MMFPMEEVGKKPGALMRFMLKAFLKPIVCGDKPYQKTPAHTDFIIADGRH
ncbi:MAG: hypothetical protein R3B47_09760 [Bacteroidia bacterium]